MELSYYDAHTIICNSVTMMLLQLLIFNLYYEHYYLSKNNKTLHKFLFEHFFSMLFKMCCFLTIEASTASADQKVAAKCAEAIRHCALAE